MKLIGYSGDKLFVSIGQKGTEAYKRIYPDGNLVDVTDIQYERLKWGFKDDIFCPDEDEVTESTKSKETKVSSKTIKLKTKRTLLERIRGK